MIVLIVHATFHLPMRCFDKKQVSGGDRQYTMAMITILIFEMVEILEAFL